MTEPATDPLLALQLKLPTHTFKAVKRRAEEMGTEEERLAFLKDCLAERERSEGRSDGKGREEE